MERKNGLTWIIVALIALALHAPSIYAQEVESVIVMGDYLLSDEIINFPSLECYVSLRSNGNLVVFSGKPNEPKDILWASKSYGEDGYYYAFIQGDGNLIVREGDPHAPGKILYAAGSNVGPGKYFLGINRQKSLTIYKGTGPDNIKAEVWNQHKGPYEAIEPNIPVQTDLG